MKSMDSRALFTIVFILGSMFGSLSTALIATTFLDRGLEQTRQ